MIANSQSSGSSLFPKTLFPIGKDYFSYGFPNHPLSPERHLFVLRRMEQLGLLNDSNLIKLETKMIDEDTLTIFHSKGYIERVKHLSRLGYGFLDTPDNPVFPKMYEIACNVVYASVKAVELITEGRANSSFNMVGGLHHAFKDRGEGFCIFNDVCVAIVFALNELGLDKILYVDIDAHHCNGVFYSFYNEPRVWIFDVHQKGIYPGTGSEKERGKGKAYGTKLNVPLEPFSGDEKLSMILKKLEKFANRARPELILLQAGVDCVKGDPLTSLNFSLQGHLTMVRKVGELASKLCDGKLVVFGGGGYDYENCAKAWSNVLRFLLEK